MTWREFLVESNMLQFFLLLDFGIVVKMGPYGFISVWLSIFRPDLGTSTPLFKILMEKCFRSFCPSPVTFLRWTLVGWLVGFVWFSVSVLRLFLCAVVICVYSARIFSIQARKYFSFPTLFFLLTFFSIVSLTSNILLMISSILLLAICSFFCLHLVQLFHLKLYSY